MTSVVLIQSFEALLRLSIWHIFKKTLTERYVCLVNMDLMVSKLRLITIYVKRQGIKFECLELIFAITQFVLQTHKIFAKQ
jgi:hypothetical protein